MEDNKISFWIKNRLFEIEEQDEDLLTAAILEHTETYTVPVILEDRIIYAPFESDRNQLFQRHGGYRRYLAKHTPKIKDVLSTIKELTNGENRRHDFATA